MKSRIQVGERVSFEEWKWFRHLTRIPPGWTTNGECLQIIQLLPYKLQITTAITSSQACTLTPPPPQMGWGEGSLGFSAQTAAPTTWTHLNGRGWIDQFRTEKSVISCHFFATRLACNGLKLDLLTSVGCSSNAQLLLWKWIVSVSGFHYTISKFHYNLDSKWGMFADKSLLQCKLQVLSQPGERFEMNMTS